MMRPVAVGDCFGWFHTRGEQHGSEIAVMLCPGLTRDALDAHQSLRLLGNALASAGYPTLRIDYPDTGDARDCPVDIAPPVEHWSVWLQSLDQALDWLRDVAGARHLVLCGLRFGATLAAVAAEQRDDVLGLALLAPVLRGQSYMRQLQLEARLQHGGDVEGLAFQELRFSGQTVDVISRIDLRDVALKRTSHVAMFLQNPSKPARDCVEAWRARGVEVTECGFAELAPMLRHNQETEGAPVEFAPLLNWIRRTIPTQPARVPFRRVLPAVLTQPGWVEQPVRFGPDDRLFGMLCQPEGPARDIAVIIGNTGRDPHYGYARFGVSFARHLAASGIASLRIDFSGLGDSVGVAGKEHVLSAMFESDRTPDISAAIDVLQARGYGQVALQGLCAGAYHALHGGIADPRVSALLLVNLPVFQWHVGDTVDFVYRKTMTPIRYMSKASDKDAWQRLLRGELDIASIARAQRDRTMTRIRERWLRLAEQRGWAGPRSFARQTMASLAARGVKTFLLFSPDDNGLDMIEQEFGKSGAGIRHYTGATLRVEPGLDHILNGREMRHVAATLMTKFLTVNLGSADVPGDLA
jgi:pimeloyl-ACP methyl ester carboxylesterase